MVSDTWDSTLCLCTLKMLRMKSGIQKCPPATHTHTQTNATKFLNPLPPLPLGGWVGGRTDPFPPPPPPPPPVVEQRPALPHANIHQVALADLEEILAIKQRQAVNGPVMMLLLLSRIIHLLIVIALPVLLYKAWLCLLVGCVHATHVGAARDQPSSCLPPSSWMYSAAQAASYLWCLLPPCPDPMHPWVSQTLTPMRLRLGAAWGALWPALCPWESGLWCAAAALAALSCVALHFWYKGLLFRRLLVFRCPPPRLRLTVPWGHPSGLPRFWLRKAQSFKWQKPRVNDSSRQLLWSKGHRCGVRVLAAPAVYHRQVSSYRGTDTTARGKFREKWLRNCSR